MIYLKSIGAGLLGALVAVLLVIAVEAVQVALVLTRQAAVGSGGIGAVSSSSGPVTLAALAGFAMAFWWRFRRLAARRPR